MEPTFLEATKQWLLLFALLATIWVPALVFRNTALKHERKGWQYFLLGLLVGFVALQLGRLVLFLTLKLDIPEQHHEKLVYLMFLIAAGIDAAAIIILRRRFSV